MKRAVAYLRVSSVRQVEKDLTEEGYSIPAQRDACVARVRAEGWTLVDEYPERGESARSADRPQLLAMLERIERDRDVDVVVVHKVDRLARNIEDHVAIRAALRRAGVSLVSVTENLEDSASGKLVEGIHALMAEFYSSNLSSEIRKGLTQKAKMGGYPHRAPSATSTSARPSAAARSPPSPSTPTAPPWSPPRSTCTPPGTGPSNGSSPSSTAAGCATAAPAVVHPGWCRSMGCR